MSDEWEEREERVRERRGRRRPPLVIQHLLADIFLDKGG